MSSFETKFKRFAKRAIIPMLWITIVLLIIAIIIIIQYSLTKQLTLKSIIVVPFILLMFYFVWILFLSVTKYKKETLLDDTERKKQWKYLSTGYKRFYIHLHILGISMSTFLIISGIWLLFIKDPYGWFLLIMGANIIVSNIIIWKRNK